MKRRPPMLRNRRYGPMPRDGQRSQQWHEASLHDMPLERQLDIAFAVAAYGDERLNGFVFSPYVLEIRKDGSQVLRDFERAEEVELCMT
ncbi:MAG: hypothetical protein GX601_05630 [Anaerolineales bacterium]|nr:hypothetical protein [Anaerolineales bacterium]